MPEYSWWERSVLERECDFIVLGAGLVGLTSAIFLKRSNPTARVRVVERSAMAAGASTRNAGFACFGMPGELLDDIAEIGPEAALKLVEMRYRGMQELLRLHGKEVLNYEACGGYEVYFQSDLHALQRVREQLSQLNHLMASGELPAEFRFSFLRNPGNSHFLSGAIGSFVQPLEGVLDSGRLWESLQELCRKEGVEVVYGVHVNGVEEQPSGVLISANNDLQLRAKKLLVCTNGFTGGVFPELASEVKPARGQVMVVRVSETDLPAGAFHYRRGYVYFRRLDESHLLIGGARDMAFEEEETDSQETTLAITRELEGLLRDEILSDTYWLTTRWAGTMGVGEKREPIVRTHGSHIVLAVRMGGMGVALGTLAAGKAVELFG
jgi:gamma-glutamylputrescine oxidase